MTITISPENRKRTVELIRPPARLRPSEWMHENAYVPSEGNSEPGKFRLSRMPWQAAMLDDPVEPGVTEIFWQMCSQFAGKTFCMTGLCEYAIAVRKSSLIVVRDTKDRAQQWMREKFLPSIEATKVMDGLLVDPRKRGSNSTSLSRKFPGGTMTIIGAKSPGAFRGTSAGIVFQDELDAYVPVKEGDPVELADRAAKTFRGAWKLKCSTPTIKGFSRINDGFLSGDQQYYFVPCPCCGQFQWLKWEQLKFSFTAEEHARFQLDDAAMKVNVAHTTDGFIASHESMVPSEFTWTIGKFSIVDSKRALYVCEHCHRGWTDTQRLQVIMSGHKDNPAVVVDGKELRAEWRATAPFNGARSRHLSGMYACIGLDTSKFSSYLHMFVEEFLKATRKGRDALMAWTNMFKNECYEDPHEAVDWQELRKRAEDYGLTIPAQVCWIAWGADVHPDRVEITHYGWGPEDECFMLRHRVIMCDFDMPSGQRLVEDYVLNTRFVHPHLGEMTAKSGAMDSGHQTKVKAVYQFCARHRLENIFSCKGFDAALGAVWNREKERTHGGIRLNFNTDYIKTTIFSRLASKVPGPRYIHFPKSQEAIQDPEAFFSGICSERRICIPQKNGGYVWQWRKHSSSTRNEPLDCFVYAWGCYEVACSAGVRLEIAQTWKQIAEKIAVANPPAPVANREVLAVPQEAKQPELPRVAPAQRRRVRIGFNPFARRF